LTRRGPAPGHIEPTKSRRRAVFAATQADRSNTVNRRLRKRARESGKTFGFCRNRGNGTIAESILKAVNLHLAHNKAANGRHKSNN
jgi:hypothetical protein